MSQIIIFLLIYDMTMFKTFKSLRGAVTYVRVRKNTFAAFSTTVFYAEQ